MIRSCRLRSNGSMLKKAACSFERYLDREEEIERQQKEDTERQQK